jgi:hypothetical protein
MWLAALRHTEMVGELAVLQAVASSAMELMLGHSPSDTFHVEVVGELATEFWKMEDRHSRLEWPTTRIYDLFLGPPTNQARLADHLDEATGQLRVELATWREADAELEAQRTSVARVRDLVLGSADRPSSLVASMSMAAELLEGWIDAVTANGVCWRSCSAVVVAVLHFVELKTELEVLGSGHSADLTQDKADVLWIRCAWPRIC